MLSPPVADASSRLAVYQRRAAIPVVLATFAVIPALVLEESSHVEARFAGHVLNWLSWFVLAGHVGSLLWLAGLGRGLRIAWLDLALVVTTAPFIPIPLDAARLIRLARVFRLGVAVSLAMRRARAVLQHRQFHFVALVAVAAVTLGGLGIYSVEGGPNAHISSVGDGIWWAIVTATTVGYGDISPRTTEGRIIAVVLMLLGIGVIGAFTATVASFFVAQDEGSELRALEARLDRLETKIDRLLDAVPAARSDDARPGPP
jgi:voltage-gated potassium channel